MTSGPDRTATRTDRAAGLGEAPALGQVATSAIKANWPRPRRAVCAGGQHIGGQIRVSAQLIDAATGAHLWADQFDADRVDLPQMQDEIGSSADDANAARQRRQELPIR
jgi:hypothetical protein